MTPHKQLSQAVESGDAVRVREVLAVHPELRRDQRLLRASLEEAQDHVAVIEALVNAGANINEGEGPRSPEGPIVTAIRSNAMNAVRWMLAHGAKLNHEVDGEWRCFALTSAVRTGNLEMVKLLVEHGADYNAVWRRDTNALWFAIVYGQTEIERYLRSVGAREPHELPGGRRVDPSVLGGPPAGTTDSSPESQLLAHVREHLGDPAPLSLGQIAVSDPPVRVHVARRPDGSLALVTIGMSARPLRVPPGQERFRHAELVILLPGDWPHGPKALDDLRSSWPYGWLLKLAAYPHEQQTWLPPTTIVDCGGSLSPETTMSCLLMSAQDTEAGAARLSDGRTVVFYFVTPIYAAERDLEKREGINVLLDRFRRKAVGDTADLRRPSVA